MATWNEFCSGVNNFTKKAVKKTGNVAKTASLRIKFEGIQNKKAAEFEKLGRLTYKQIKTSVSQAEAISEVINAIDALRKEEKEIKEQIEELKKNEEVIEEVEVEAEAESTVVAEETNTTTETDA